MSDLVFISIAFAEIVGNALICFITELLFD